MRDGKPVIDRSSDDPERRGRPVRIAPSMWGRAKHDALVKKLAPRPKPLPTDMPRQRAPRTDYMLSGISTCGQCGHRAYIDSHDKRHEDGSPVEGYTCRARTKGFPHAEHCTPAPFIEISELDQMAEVRFLELFGAQREYEVVYDEGSDTTARLAEVEAERTRLRDDRNAGLYDDQDDAEWYRAQYKQLTEQFRELKATPKRAAGMFWRPTGTTVADRWNAATTSAERRSMMASFDFHAEIFHATAPTRVVFTANDADTSEVARRESWEEHMRVIEAEEEYRAHVEKELAAAEADQNADTPNAYEVPTLADRIAGRWTRRPEPDRHLLTA
jgi:site-specific DNA recombinase